jgi:hypothetical protein
MTRSITYNVVDPNNDEQKYYTLPRKQLSFVVGCNIIEHIICGDHKIE